MNLPAGYDETEEMQDPDEEFFKSPEFNRNRSHDMTPKVKGSTTGFTEQEKTRIELKKRRSTEKPSNKVINKAKTNV